MHLEVREHDLAWERLQMAPVVFNKILRDLTSPAHRCKWSHSCLGNSLWFWSHSMSPTHLHVSLQFLCRTFQAHSPKCSSYPTPCHTQVTCPCSLEPNPCPNNTGVEHGTDREEDVGFVVVWSHRSRRQWIWVCGQGGTGMRWREWGRTSFTLNQRLCTNIVMNTNSALRWVSQMHCWIRPAFCQEKFSCNLCSQVLIEVQSSKYQVPFLNFEVKDNVVRTSVSLIEVWIGMLNIDGLTMALSSFTTM